MKNVILFALAVLVLSCQGYVPPKKYNFEKTRVIEKSFDETWSKLIQWFGNNNTPIKTIDKSSGIISTEYDLRADNASSYLDCGTSGFGASVKTNDFKGNFNIVVEKVQDKSTKVTINCFFKGVRADLEYVGGKYVNVDKNIDCNTTGVLESQLFEYIAK